MMPKHFEDFQKAMEPYRKISELTKQFSYLNQLVNPATQLQFKVNESFELLKKLQPFDHINSMMKQLEAFRGVGDRLKELIEGTPKHLSLIAKYGWYAEADNGLSFFEYLGSLVEDGKINELDDFLFKYYTENLGEIIKTLCERHPERSHFFKEIEAGHRSKLYTLSIPSTLAQIDGISHDYCNKKFFIKNKKNDNYQYLPEITSKIMEVSESVVELIVSPIMHNTPIIARESDLHEFPVQLNRHAILHGTDKAYGTELNCLKCISLLKYLSDVLDLIESRKTFKNTQAVN